MSSVLEQGVIESQGEKPMIVRETVHLMQQEHYRDLLREAEQERLLRQTEIRHSGQEKIRHLAAGALRGLAVAAFRTSDALSPRVDSRSAVGAAGQVY